MKRSLLLALGAMLLLGLVASGCGDDASSGDPAGLIDKAWAKMSDTDSVREEFDMQVEIDGDLSDMGEELADMMPMAIGVAGTADLDMSDEEDIKADVEVELDLQELMSAIAGAGGDEMTEEDAMGMSMFASMLSDIKVRIVDQMLYMQLMGSWYEMPMDESGIEDITGSTSPIDVGAGDIDAQCYQDELTPSSVLTDIEEKGSEDVDGDKTTHISARLDTSAMIDTLVEVNDKCGGEEMDDEEIADAKEVLEGMLTKADMEFWIDGDDNIRQMTIDMEMDLAAAAEAAGSVMDEGTTESMESVVIKLTGTLKMSNFGEEITVEAPDDAMPMEDLFDSLGGLGGLGGSSGSGGSDDDTGTTGNTGTTGDFDMTDEELQQLEDEMEQLEQDLQNELDNIDNM